MKKILISLVLLCTLFMAGCSQSNNGEVETPDNSLDLEELLPYYSSVTGSDTTLQSELKVIISANVKSVSYSDLWEICAEANEDPNNSNNVILLYSGLSVHKTDDKNTGGSTGWNREHVWPQSLGGYKTDAHHVMPDDYKTNNTRGNNPFAVGGSFASTSTGFVTTSKSSGSTFEPRDEVKGDVARICMYVAVKYDFDINMVISESLALQWHAQDPVDAFEQNRNDVIFSHQNNRNPFIDHPQFAYSIWE
ncbi:MAG: endonuclease [bacterium]